MAMLITKFHRLIQNRLLWLAFLIIVVFSFVIWGTQMPDTEAQGPNAAGRLNGEDISFEEFQRARFNTYLSIVLMTGRSINITPEVDEQLHEMAWQRIATLREAARLGLRAGNEEVVNSIRGFEFLQANGQFSQQAYDQFAQQFLAQFRATKREFEEHVRQEIVLQKLRLIVERTQLISPLEISRTFNTLTDTFTVEYVSIPPSAVEADVKVSVDDARAFFNDDPEQFTLPERVMVKAAVFAAADYTGEVSITDEAIEEYYDLNLDDFAKPAAEPAGEDTLSVTPTEYKPLEDVREEIIATLKERESTALAAEKAADFVQELSYERSQGQGAFDQIAASNAVRVIKTAPFAISEIPAELDEATPALTRAAFNLSDDDDYYYSDPITTSNFVYVLALAGREPSRMPEFEEVREKAEALARDFAIYNALTEKAREIQGSAVAGLSAGLSFSDIMDEYKLTTVKPAAFTVNSQNIDPVISASLIRPILVLNPGEVTDVIEAGDSILIAYIKERTPAADLSAETMRTQIISTLRQQAAGTLFADYQNHLLKQQGFEDLTRRNRGSSAGDENADEDADAEAES